MQQPEIHKPNTVEDICNLARIGDEVQLAEFLKTHCVGEYNSKGENAVYILAKEENEEAVDLLVAS